MTLEGALRSIILADETLAGELGDRVIALNAGQQPSRPHVTYTCEDGEDPSPSFDGPSGFTTSDFDFYIVADTYVEVSRLTTRVRNVLEAGNGQTIQDVQIVFCRFVTQSDIEEGVLPGDSTPVYMRQLQMKTLARVV